MPLAIGALHHDRCPPQRRSPPAGDWGGGGFEEGRGMGGSLVARDRGRSLPRGRRDSDGGGGRGNGGLGAA